MTRTLLQLHLLVLLMTSTAILGELISVSAAVLVVWRTLLAAVGALAFAHAVRKKPVWPGGRNVAALLGIGAIVGIHWLCFFGAIKLANVSISLAGMATVSLFTSFTEPLLLRRRIRPSEVFLGLFVFAGIMLIAGVAQGFLVGLLVALCGAFLAAIFPVLNLLLVHRGGDPQVMVGWEMVGAFLVTFLTLPLWEKGGYPALLGPQPLDWLWLALLAWVCTVFGHAFHIHLLRRITAYQGNLAFNFEPIYGILAAALLFGDWRSLHPAFYVGAATIVLANLLHPLLERRRLRHLRAEC